MKCSLELSDVQTKTTSKNIKNKQIEKKVTKHDINPSPSKITSTLQNIINPSSTSLRNIKTTNSSKDIDKIKSTTKSPQHSILSKRSSMQVPSNKSIVAPLKIPVNVLFNFFMIFYICLERV